MTNDLSGKEREKSGARKISRTITYTVERGRLADVRERRESARYEKSLYRRAKNSGRRNPVFSSPLVPFVTYACRAAARAYGTEERGV